MHSAAFRWVERQSWTLTPATVVEVGSRDVNGSVRPLFERPGVHYTGVDLQPGRRVDVVADAHHWAPPHPVDLVICCEVLEHEPDPAGLVARMIGWLAPGGVLLVTVATEGRDPHCHRCGALLVPPRCQCDPDQHYANVTAADLVDVTEGLDVTLNLDTPGDLYVTVRR